MCQSRFILCPAGDAPWSFRYYETLMCKSIPVVISSNHIYRTKEEATIPYRYILADKIGEIVEYNDMVEVNTNLFKKYHMLP